MMFIRAPIRAASEGDKSRKAKKREQPDENPLVNGKEAKFDRFAWIWVILLLKTYIDRQTRALRLRKRNFALF